MNTTELQRKRRDVQTEIVHVVKLSVTDVYIKVTEKSLTMSAPTVLGDLRTYQLVLSLVTQIVYGNPRGHS
jgi:hypothetical protein